MPDNAAVHGLVCHALVDKAELRVVVDEPLFAGQDCTLSPLLSRILNGTVEQFARVAVFPVLRQGVQTEEHLPRAIFVVHGCFRVHFVGQVGLVRHKAIEKRDELTAIEHQPEVVAVVSDSLGKFLFCRRLGHGKALGFHCRDRVQIVHRCCSDLHGSILFIYSHFSRLSSRM